MNETFFPIVLALILAGCSNEKIEITPYYINENWSKKNDNAGGNSIAIQRMTVKKDSIINPFSHLDNAEILGKLEEDTSFMYYTNVKIEGKSYKGKKIYFNQYNGFYWESKSRYNSDDTTQTVGSLKRGNWYKFSDLVSYPYFVYIYVDSSKKVHRFDVNLANY
jgi:hypothetical protein